MNKQEFQKEIALYNDDDLALIIETQKDLYTPEEMELLAQEQKKRIQAKQDLIIANLPTEIICPKCDGKNAFENDICQFCGCKLDKSRYYQEGWNNSEIDNSDLNESEEGTSYTFHYIISILIPLIGFIVGAIFLGKDTD